MLFIFSTLVLITSVTALDSCFPSSMSNLHCAIGRYTEYCTMNMLSLVMMGVAFFIAMLSIVMMGVAFLSLC
jgi:hypothetical protein